nr:hypothetical protein [Candidatus Sigynarchaeota archaeon]
MITTSQSQRGNRILAIIIMASMCIRLIFICLSPQLYEKAPRGIIGPQIELAGGVMASLLVLCPVIMAIGLWHIDPWHIVALIGGSAGIACISLFVFPTILAVFVPIVVLHFLFRASKAKAPRRNLAQRLVKAIPLLGKVTPRQKQVAANVVLLACLIIPVVVTLHVQYNLIPENTCARCTRESYPSANFTQRQEIYRNASGSGSSLGAQIIRVYMNQSADEDAIAEGLQDILALRDTMDFDLNYMLRILYLDKIANVLSPGIKETIKGALLACKYWYTEPSDNDTAIYWTENHQILFHAAELLAGQLWPGDVFSISDMTGTEHAAHATPMIEQWLGWKGKFGFTEWHSDVYLNMDIGALVNLVDFANNTAIATKAAMVLDLIGFDLACNYYKGLYATAHGRTYDDNVRGQGTGAPAREDIAEAAWLFLGLGYHRGGGRNLGAVSLGTTVRYAAPPVIEAIAKNATVSLEHRGRDGIGVDEGATWGIAYDEESVPFWWEMAAPVAPPVIEASFAIMEHYGIRPEIVCGYGIPEILKFGSSARGLTLSEYSELLGTITRGTVLGTANTYTYRTSRYQLSGVQDRLKGYAGFQEHYWQASLDDDACVYTNAPGGLGFAPFTGGWKPRTTLYKNVGIIQYDRPSMPIEGELAAYLIDGAINMYTGERPYNHAYFPRWAFDEVQSLGKWTLGSKNGSYIALYSDQPTFWASTYDLQVLGRKNAWIVELGSVDECGSFDAFIASVTAASIHVVPLAMGYDISFDSPSRGPVHVAWDGPMAVNGTDVDLGPYPRFDNPYCYQEFGTTTTVIEHANQRLTLDFDAGTRTHETW